MSSIYLPLFVVEIKPCLSGLGDNTKARRVEAIGADRADAEIFH